MRNLILSTDSYKLTHAPMYPEGTTHVYSYLEARRGAAHQNIVFFGLQPLLNRLAGSVVTAEDVAEAKRLTDAHLGPGIFNEEGWNRIVEVHGGYLPVRIRALPEGTVVPQGNVMMTVENTDSQLPWLTNALESLLLHVWYPITVASLSRSVKELFANKLERAGVPLDGIDFMLHDFGYRGVSSDESAETGGAAHLVNFQGTDTVLAITFIQEMYGAYEMPAFSVPATEHSVMTAQGRLGEVAVVNRLLDQYPTGILSLVADSYDVYEFTRNIGTRFKDRVLARDGKVVVRPDSGDPTEQLPELLDILWECFGGTTTEKGYHVLDPHVGLLWGDGIDGEREIETILGHVMDAGYAPSNIVFGMGGGLLQKVNRDTERFAFKCSAQKRNGVWMDVQKDPLDQTKKSKAGRLRLRMDSTGEVETVRAEEQDHDHIVIPDLLETVFENGQVLRLETFAEVRKRAALK